MVVNGCNVGSPYPLGHHSSGRRSRSAGSVAGVNVTSPAAPAARVTRRLTRAPASSAATVTVRAVAAALRTGTTSVTSATDVSGRFGSRVSTRGSPSTASPVERSRTWFQMPAPRSRTPGIQSQPLIEMYPGRSCCSALEFNVETPSGPLSPGLPGCGIGSIRTASACASFPRNAVVTSKAARATGWVSEPTAVPSTQTSAWWSIPSNSSQTRRPASNPRGSVNSRRYHQLCRESASGARMLPNPDVGSGSLPCSTSAVWTVPGTVAGSHVDVSTPARASAAPSADGSRESMVNVQPDSSATVPSAAVTRPGGRVVWRPQSVQPVASGRGWSDRP